MQQSVAHIFTLYLIVYSSTSVFSSSQQDGLIQEEGSSLNINSNNEQLKDDEKSRTNYEDSNGQQKDINGGQINDSFTNNKLLPEFLADYCRHINLSPRILIILFVIGLTWFIMYTSEQLWSISKETKLLRDRLCKSHAELFKTKSERDTIDEELNLIKEKYKHRHQEYQSMADRLSKMEIAAKKLDEENSAYAEKLVKLEEQNKTKKLMNEKLEASNKLLETKIKNNRLEIEKLEAESAKLTEQIENINSANETLKQSCDELKTGDDKLQDDLKKSESNVNDLLTEKEIMIQSSKDVARMKTELEKRDSEIQALQTLIETIEKDDVNIDFLADGRVDLDKLQNELTMSKEEVAVISEEREYLAKRMADLEVKVATISDNFHKISKEKEESLKSYSTMKSYFTEKEVAMQTELGALQLEYNKTLKFNEASTGRIAALNSSNDELKNQITTLTQDISSYENSFRKHILTLENKYHEIYLSERALHRDFDRIRQENQVLRQRLNQSSQSDIYNNPANLINSQAENDIVPPPPPPPMPPIFYDKSFNSSSFETSDWSLPPPPPMPSSLTSSGFLPPPVDQYADTSYTSLPSSMQHPYSSRPFIGPIGNRDSYSPYSQLSQGNHSVRSDRSNHSRDSNLVKPQLFHQSLANQPKTFQEPNVQNSFEHSKPNNRQQHQ